jgi:CCR4-NOT transcriptional regulation complex NOT5 subunit
MRLLYNDKIDACDVNNIREDVEYYVENYEDGSAAAFANRA